MSKGAAEHGRSPKAFLIGAAVLLVLLLLLLAWLRPMAPRRIDILTGPEGSSYHAYGLRFRDHLKREGITANVVETNGALDKKPNSVSNSNTRRSRPAKPSARRSISTSTTVWSPAVRLSWSRTASA